MSSADPRLSSGTADDPMDGDRDRTSAFRELIDAARSCQRCPRMKGRTRVLGCQNGSLQARVLFVAEAPGRLGADVSGIPLSRDRTGKTFEWLLSASGLTRDNVFITNAVLCNPQDDGGRNDRPTRAEITNCGDHLKRLIDMLEPEWVATLGRVALEAVGGIDRHSLVLRRDVGKPARWYGRWLIALYHPGPRALIHRPLDTQREDYLHLAAYVAGPR